MDEKRTTEETLIKSVEKLVRMTAKQSEDIKKMNDKITKLEAETNQLKAALHIEKNNIALVNFNNNAENDLHEFLVDESKKDALDTMITKDEIQTGMINYVEEKNKFLLFQNE